MKQKILFPVFVLLAVLFGACGVRVDVDIDRGSGNVVTETRPVQGFDRVVLSGIGDVEVRQGDQEALEIDGEDNVIRGIKTEVKDGTLWITFDRKTIIPTEPVKFRLTMPNVRGLETRGVSNIHAEDLKTESLEITISGTGNVTLRDLEAGSLTTIVSGAGNFNASGEAQRQKVTLSGAGNYHAEDLRSDSAEITISGLGKVTIWVTETLEVAVSGTGGVDYYGSPQVDQRISGLGRIQKVGEK
jgi:hypothetical protein